MNIFTHYQSYRKKPFVARWYEGAQQRNRFFASAASRDELIEGIKETTQRADPALQQVEPHRLIGWQQAMAIAPDADPL